MSDKFKKHIIDNLQPPFIYNLEKEFGISYDEKTYRHFICKYFNLTPEDYQIETMGNDEFREYSFTRYRDIDEGEMMTYVECSVKSRYQNYTKYEMFWDNWEGKNVYQKKETLHRDCDIPPWLSK